MGKNYNAYLLVFGTWVSKLGNIVFDYANNVWISHYSGFGPIALAIYQSSDTIVNIILNCIGGVISDRKSRKKILFITDFISFISCFIASFFLKSVIGFYCIIFVNVILALTTSFSSPAYKAIVKEALDKGQINRYNSIANAGTEIIKLIGPMIALSIVNIVGTQAALFITSLSFLISSMTKIFIYIEKDQYDTKIAKHNIYKDLKAGFLYLFCEKEILFIIIISMFVNFFLSGYNLILPYTDNFMPSIVSDLYGKLLIAEALGGIVGSILNSRLNLTNDMKNEFYFLSGCGISLILFSISAIMRLSPYILCFCIFMFGTFLTIYNIQFITFIQNKVSSSYLGRVFSIIFTFSVLLMPVGSFLFAHIFRVKQVISFLVFGLGILILSMISISISDKYRSAE